MNVTNVYSQNQNVKRMYAQMLKMSTISESWVVVVAWNV